jgi:stage III sporulation protein AD
MIQTAILAIVGVLLALQLKAQKPEYAIYLCLGISLLIFLKVTEQLQVILDGIRSIQDRLPLNAAYLQTLLKIVGITYIAEFASDLCKDAGYQTIAGQIQIFGKLSVLMVSIPILTALLDTIQTFLGG